MSMAELIRRLPLIVIVAAIWCAGGDEMAQAQPTTAPALKPGGPLRVSVTYDPKVTSRFTGRVYLMFTTAHLEPRLGPNWFNPQPFFAKDVVDWIPNTPILFDDSAISFPDRLSTLATHEYSVQAVLRLNPDCPDIGSCPGSASSKLVRLKTGGQDGPAFGLHIDEIVPEQPFRESDRIKLVTLRSDLLSEFHKREIVMRASVILPKDYGQHSQRNYPALYWIGGFDSDHRMAEVMMHSWDRGSHANDIIRVVLDPLCYGGNHVFADSANNGPRGRALVEEFIPHLERTFRLVGSPQARFLSGHSSGGWASLWLQISHPLFFGGAWSIAPDPVDFRDFQRIDLYAPDANMYVDQHGERRPLARARDRVVVWYDTFAHMETVIGEGGQLRSFEWVFSPRRPDGLPEALYDRQSGAVNRTVAESWKRYDIRLVLEENWPIYAGQLDGGRKLNVFMGDLDTFYLEGAVRLLQESQARLGSAAVIEIEPGKDHMTIATKALRDRIDKELLSIFQDAHGN